MNIASIIVAAVLLFLIAMATVFTIKNKDSSGCSGDCASCISKCKEENRKTPKV